MGFASVSILFSRMVLAILIQWIPLPDEFDSISIPYFGAPMFILDLFDAKETGS